MEINKLLSLHTSVTLILSCVLFSIKGLAIDHHHHHYYPVSSVWEYRFFGGAGLLASSRHRELTAASAAAPPFQLCLQCQCCAAGGSCEFMPCCFSIDCNLPNKPYGVCAFLPKSCNCTSCPN